MKFVFIADIHLSKYGQDKREELSHLPERLHSIKEALYEVAQYCILNNIHVVVIGGDVLHGKSIIHAIAQDIMLKFFEDHNFALKFYVIDGNHDLSGKGANAVSALSSLQHVPGVTWVSHEMEAYRLESSDVLMIPYSHKVVENVKKHKAKILISHFGLSEGVLNSGMSIIQDISVKDLIGRYDLVLLGHYHKPQQLSADNFDLYYVGSLIQLDWGEKGEEKRFLVVDTDTMIVTSYAITSYRRHIEIEVTPDTKTEALKEAREYQESGDHVKLIMKETVDLGEEGQEFNVIDKTEKDITDRGISSSMTKEDIHKRYLQIKHN